ncbi:MAG: hypothetical protein J4F49_13295 [Rhodobacteraceae bacterium]|nr:hypothetical protein [Paracoccaceae bacterium]
MSNARHLYPKGALILRELGLRDGLQMTAGWLGTAAKIEWINLAFAAGVRHFEVGSFLPPSRFPQFADLRELIAAVDALPGAVSSALVLNERGIADALETPVDEIVIPVSVTEAHSMANMRRSRSSAVGLIRTAIGKKGLSDTGPVINAAAAVAFGCSISGEVRVDDVLDLIGECVEAGAEALAVADTVGFAGPAQVAGLCSRLVNEFDDFPIKVHLHDTRGTGIAKASVSLTERSEGWADVPLLREQPEMSYLRISYSSASAAAFPRELIWRNSCGCVISWKGNSQVNRCTEHWQEPEFRRASIGKPGILRFLAPEPGSNDPIRSSNRNGASPAPTGAM